MLRSYLLHLRIRGQRSMRLILWGCRWRACESSCQMWCRCLQPPRSTPERRQSQTLWLWLVHACEPTGPTYPCGDLHGQAGGQWGCTSILAQGAPQVQKPWWLCDGSRVWLCSILTRRLQAGEVLGRWPFSRSQAQTDLCLQCLVRQTSGQTLQEDQLVCSWAGVFMVQKLCTPIERVTSTPACIKGSVLCKGAQQGHPTEAGNVPQQTPSPRKKGIEKVCLHHEDCEEACDEDVQGYEGNEEVGCLLWTSSWTRHWMVPRLWRTWMSRLGIGSILSSPPTIWIYWLHSSQKVVAIACLHFCPTYHLSIAYTTTIGILFFMLHLFVCFISQKYCLSIAGTTPIFLYNLYLFHCFLSA